MLAVVGSVLLVLQLFDTLGSLRSTDMRQSVEEFLAEPPGRRPRARRRAGPRRPARARHWRRGALAAAALVRGIFVLQRHRGARIGSRSSPRCSCSPCRSPGVMPVLLAVAVGMLWSRPARDWFDGVAPAQSAASAARARPSAPARAAGSARTPAVRPPADPPCRRRRRRRPRRAAAGSPSPRVGGSPAPPPAGPPDARRPAGPAGQPGQPAPAGPAGPGYGQLRPAGYGQQAYGQPATPARATGRRRGWGRPPGPASATPTSGRPR